MFVIESKGLMFKTKLTSTSLSTCFLSLHILQTGSIPSLPRILDQERIPILSDTTACRFSAYISLSGFMEYKYSNDSIFQEQLLNGFRPWTFGAT